MKILPLLLAVTLSVVSAWRWPWQTESRKVLVIFRGHKRFVTVEDDSYQSLLDGFLDAFSDLLPSASASDILFQVYEINTRKCGEYLHEGGNTDGYRWFCARTRKISPSYPLVDNKTYNFWSMSSRVGNGYLRQQGTATITADGDGQIAESQWTMHEIKDHQEYILWTFFSRDKKNVLVVEQDQVTVKDPNAVNGTEDQFLPYLNGRYKSFLPFAYLYTTTKKFLAADGNGTVRLVTNNVPKGRLGSNPTPQALFIPFLCA